MPYIPEFEHFPMDGPIERLSYKTVSLEYVADMIQADQELIDYLDSRKDWKIVELATPSDEAQSSLICWLLLEKPPLQGVPRKAELLHDSGWVSTLPEGYSFPWHLDILSAAGHTVVMRDPLSDGCLTYEHFYPWFVTFHSQLTYAK